MKQYTFFCPHKTCEEVFLVHAENEEEGENELVKTAANHLRDFHPESQEMKEEAEIDIRSHMQGMPSL